MGKRKGKARKAGLSKGKARTNAGDGEVRSLPEGVSVSNISQAGQAITIDGEAQSNARVSSFMRKLESSEWLQAPELDIIQVKDASEVRISSFKMRFKQVIPKADEEEES